MPLCTPRPLAESDQELTRVCKEARVGVFLLQLHDVLDTETSTESSPCSPQVVARTDEGGAFVVATAPTRHHLEADWEVLLAKLPEVLRALDASSAGGGAPLLTQAIAALSQRLSADTRSRQHQRFSIYEQRLSSDASATIRSATRAELGGVELDDGDVTTQEGGDCRRQSSDRQLSQGAEEEEEESEADVECEYVVPALALQAVSTVVPDADGGEVESLELDASEIQLQRDAFGLPPGEPFIEYYLCGMEGPLQAHIRGKLYVWQHHLCFRPYVPCSFLGWNSLVVRFKDVVLIKKTLGHLVFPNAILVRTNKQKHIFVGFLRRDECLSIIEFLWEKRHETEPIIVSGQPLSRMLGMIKYPKESRELLQLFSLADTEVLVEQYVCSYKEGSLPTRGRMYISQNFICFTSTLIIQLRPTKVILPFEHVVSITKDSTAFVIPNAIEVIVQSPGSAVQRQLFFQGFMSRDRTFSVLTTLWRRAKARQSSLRVLVCGASTPQGKHLTKLLVRRNVNVRAGIRYERLRKELVSLGSEVVTVDYNQPDSLRKAMEGVDKVVFIPPLAENMKQQTVNLVEAALASTSVTHIVRLAPLASGNRVMETPIFCMHREAEQAIEKSGIPYTFLRCSPFMQSLFHFYDPAQANLAVPLGNAKTTLVDARDVAAAAAEVLCPSASADPADDGGDCAQEGQLTSFRSQTRAAQTFHNQTINLSSREVLTCQQIADVMSTVLGKTVTYVDTSAVSFVNEADSDKHLRLHGSRSAWFLRTLAESFAHAREDDVQSASDELAAILRHQAPISLEEFVRDHRDAFADNALIYFNSDEMNALFCLFTELDANSDGLLQWEDFHGAMKPAFHHPFIPQALCRAFDPDGSGYVDFAQFARGMSVMTRGHLDERLTLGFRMLDRDRNGLIHWPDLELFLESLSLNLVNMGLLSQRDLLLPDDTDPDVDDQLPEREGSFLANTFNFVARIPSGVLKRRNDDGEPPPPAPPSAASSGGGGRLHCSAPDHERRGAASTVVGEPKPRSRRRGFLSSFVKIQSAILSTRPPADDGGSSGGDGASDNTKAGGVIAVKRSNSESTALDRRRRQRQQQRGAGEAGGGGDGQDDEGEGKGESESESRVEGAGAKNEDDEKGVETRRRNFVLRFGAQLWAQLDVNKDGNVPLATWKEVLKKRTAYVESLGLLGNPEEDTSEHRRERRAKKALTLGHPSWDTVLHILLCIRRAIEEEVPEGAGEAHDLRREGSGDPLFGGLGSSATALISSALAPSADRADAAPPPQFLVRLRCRLLESQASSAGGDGAWIGQSFAPAVFGQLRDAFGIDPLEYRVALGPERLFASLLTGSLSALEEIVSSGRSGSFLYRSVDGRYLIKTLPPEEKSFFRQILPSYFDHMIKNPNSLLTRFCGLHKISGNKGRTTSFVVMENVIHTDKPVHEQYDLKGSTVNRSVRLGEKDEMGSVAQKDNDFQRKLQLGPLAPTFVAQIESDCKWLEGHGICDYSLLVGIHHSPRDGRQQPDATAAERPPPQSVFKRHHGGVSGGGGGSGGEVYWLGLIDILTTYSFKKKSEHTLKSIFHDPSQISAIPPGPYRERFVAYMRSIVE